MYENYCRAKLQLHHPYVLDVETLQRVGDEVLDGQLHMQTVWHNVVVMMTIHYQMTRILRMMMMMRRRRKKKKKRRKS